MTTTQLNVAPVTGAIGAEIHGIDLSEPLSQFEIDAVRRALLEHLVVFFRDQHLTPDSLKTFGSRFGELDIHPLTRSMDGHPEIIEVIKEPEETINWGDDWHTDLTALPEPPLGSILYALEIPPYSGDTHFLNMYLAYETLSAAMRHFVDGLTVHHVQNLSTYRGFKSMRNFDDARASQAVHPLVRTHPETGKRALFLSRPADARIVELSEAESAALIDYLHEHASNLDLSCRFRWRAGSVAMWDNRCTRHRVTADYFYAQRGFAPARRHMQRVTIRGDRPV
ncbi:MAG: TauD/TfdA dioxygenase family protein [Burkholderiaceae bacterium]